MVRHGQTDYSKADRYQGGLSEPSLTPEGKIEASALSEMLGSLSFNCIYSSPLKRAADTLRIVKDGLSGPVITTSLLTEADVPEWRGLPKAEILSRWPDAVALWRQRPHLFFSEGGRRPLHDVYARVQEFMGTLDPENERVLVVGHDHVNRALIATSLGLPITFHSRFPQQAGAASAITRDRLSGAYALRRSNISPTRHLLDRVEAGTPSRVIFVRHGVTRANAAGVFQGRLDIPLNDVGKLQARDLKILFNKIPPFRLFSSNLQRAVETANAIAAGVTDPIIDPRLSEFDFGSWTGRTEREISSTCGAERDNLLSMRIDRPIQGGERLGDFIGRVSAMLTIIWREARRSGTIVVVSHDVVIRMSIALSLGVDATKFWLFPIGNAEISELVSDETGLTTLRQHGVMNNPKETMEDERYF